MRPVSTAQPHADSEKQPAAVPKTQAPVAPPEKEKNEMTYGEKQMQALDKEYEAFRDSLKGIRGRLCMVKVISDKSGVNIAENPDHPDYIATMMKTANYVFNDNYKTLGVIAKDQFNLLLGIIAKLEKSLFVVPRNYDFCGTMFDNIFVLVLRMGAEISKSQGTQWLHDQLFLKLQENYKAIRQANLSTTRYLSTADAVQQSDKKIAVDLGRKLETSQAQFQELSRTFDQLRSRLSTSQFGLGKSLLFKEGNGRHHPASSKADKGAAPTDLMKITWVANLLRFEIVELLLERRSDFMGQHKRIVQGAESLGLAPVKESAHLVNARLIDQLIKEVLSHYLTGKKLKDIFLGIKLIDLDMMGLATTLMEYTSREGFEKNADEALPEFVMKKQAKSISETAIKLEIAKTLYQLYKPQKPGEVVNKEKVFEPDAAIAKEFLSECKRLEVELGKEQKNGSDLHGQIKLGGK